MARRSAGILLFRRAGGLSVLLVHPGGPFWKKKDKGAWQIPKGLIEPGEDDAMAARREVEEELGMRPTGEMRPLAEIRQAGGKRVKVFALEHDFDPDAIHSNMFEIEWPPRSGHMTAFPEVDAARWMPIDEALEMMLESQKPLLQALRELAERTD